MPESPTCRHCESTALQDLGAAARARFFAGTALTPPLPGGRIFRCRVCRLAQRLPILSPEAYRRLYESASDHWAEPALRNDQLKARDHIRARLPGGGRVLDIGCAAGGLMLAMGEQFQTFGIEPSQEAASKAAASGVRILGSDFACLATTAQRFDVICAIDVIEHVPEPETFLRTAARALTPGGCIVISTGNADALAWRWMGPQYYYSHNAEHISFLSPDWCRQLVDRGFAVEIVDAGFRHQNFPLPLQARKWLRCMARWLASRLEPLHARLTKAADHRLGPRIIVAEPGLFRDHMLVVFQPTNPG